jgi:hypothetical protein
MGNDEKKPSRPNAKYTIEADKPRPPGEELVFYYSRERRLANAPKAVQNLYDEKLNKKPNLFRTLTATKPLALLFSSIMLLSAAILVLSVFGRLGDHTFGGNNISAEAMKFEGTTLIILTKTFKNEKEAYTGLVDLGVAPSLPKGGEDQEFPLFTNRIFFSLNPTEEYRFSVPFEADELIFYLQGETESTSFRIKPK